MKKPIVFFLLVQLYLTSHILYGQGLSSDQIDSLVNESMSAMPQVGIAVAVVQNGKVTHAKGYGLTSISSKEQVNESKENGQVEDTGYAQNDIAPTTPANTSGGVATM